MSLPAVRQQFAKLRQHLRCLLWLAIVTATGHRQGLAASYIDLQNLVELSVTPANSFTSGHLAWQFKISPVSSSNTISSIDAATGSYGFHGTDLRQVHPDGRLTPFEDFNALFPTGEDSGSDSQFSFAQSNVTVVPNTIQDSSSALKAAFTGFNLISETTLFAQVVLPIGSYGEFSGAFAVRPLSGGLPELAEFQLVPFGGYTADFDNDGDVDSEDLTHPLNGWQVRFGNDLNGGDFLAWQRQLAGPPILLRGQHQIPEPSTGLLVFLSFVVAGFSQADR